MREFEEEPCEILTGVLGFGYERNTEFVFSPKASDSLAKDANVYERYALRYICLATISIVRQYPYGCL